jgi:hypothetical protein
MENVLDRDRNAEQRRSVLRIRITHSELLRLSMQSAETALFREEGLEFGFPGVEQGLEARQIVV